MARREIQEINAGSMADIAFLLLIFFLVTTTMDTDAGISITLPPMPENEEQKDDKQINERNIFVVLVNSNDQLLVEGELMDVQNLKEAAKDFIANPEDKENLPEKVLVDVDYFGTVPVSKQIISLRNDRGTSYGMYLRVQNELAAAYNELRNELAIQKFGTPFDELESEKQDAIQDIYVKRISEAEPKNIGGN